MIKGSVSNIETLGLVDGPGIRTVVFLSGCKLRCKYCHNPEMWRLNKPNYTPKELVNQILKNKPYFEQNNGGVTFSGGEPLLQTKFLKEVCKLLKKENIHIALDTSGVGNDDYYKLLPYIDLVILDIKHIDPLQYKELTGQEITISESFIQELNKRNIEVWIRQVIVPGLNDNEEYLLKLKEYLKKINNIKKIEFLPYHNLAIKKYQELDIEYPYQDKESMDKEKTALLYQKFINIK